MLTCSNESLKPFKTKSLPFSSNAYIVDVSYLNEVNFNDVTLCKWYKPFCDDNESIVACLIYWIVFKKFSDFSRSFLEIIVGYWILHFVQDHLLVLRSLILIKNKLEPLDPSYLSRTIWSYWICLLVEFLSAISRWRPIVVKPFQNIQQFSAK